jgi:serine/threonine protein kinase
MVEAVNASHPPPFAPHYFSFQSNMPATSALLQEGRYRLDHPIAENSESTVFHGYDTVRDTKVVVKEIVARMNKVTTAAQEETLKLNFANQAKMLASVRHDSLINVEDYFSEIGRQYLVMESIEGDDLQSVVERNNLPFPLSDAAAWADQILDALHYLHNFAPPLVHRHVQPKHIRLQPDGKVKLLAYGTPAGDTPISTSIDGESGSSAPLNYSPLELLWEDLDAASQKVIINSYDDRSEKILKSAPDARSDLYSVGATLYYILTGRVPVDPLERSIEMLDGNADPLLPPSKINPSVPEEVSDVIMRAMQIKREERFDSAVIMRQVLRTAISRSQEQAEEEERELAEAAAELKFAEKARQEQIQKLVEQKARELEEQKAREIEEEKRRAAELLEQKLREAEEMRLAAELRAAEAEQRLKEEEAARKTAAEAAIHSSQPSVTDPENIPYEENPLELTVEASSAQALAGEPKVAAFEEVASLLTEPEVVAEEAEEPVATATDLSESKTVAAADVSESIETTFSYEEAGSGSKMPMIIGALVVLVLAAVGGWMFLGSGSSPAPQQTAPQSAATTTAPAAPAPATEQPAEQQPASPAQQAAVTEEQPSESQPSAEPSQARTSAKPTPAKAAKTAAEPAKTPEKKKVTVDDLINDN